jgi:MSHA biogenesis protein MshO
MCASTYNCKKKLQGFTLIEVIAVIVILSLVAVLGGKFVVESTKAYQSTQTRSRLINTSRQAVERMSRQLRVALPYSVRITNSNSCLEFMPIVSGGNYINPVSVNDGGVTNGVAAASIIGVSPHSISSGSAQYVSIGAKSSAELYGVSPGSRATLSSRTAVQLTLSGVKIWLRNSVSQRFYLLDSPQAFCVVANQLRFYSNQDATSASVDTSSSFSLLADYVTTTAPFSLTAGSENRNVNVLFNIGYRSNGESVILNQSVMIRNVP